MPADISTLLAEAQWLTKLARSLTRDAADADDVVQETYAAALRSPPDEDRPPRPWLRRVLINAVRMRKRGASRRSANEEGVEQSREPMRTPPELLERARLERKLNDLVLELEEPYRTTVLLRYREGLTAQMIAERQGIPAGTVRSRLKTALDRLRRELDEHERPARWRAVLVAPLVAPRAQPPFWRIAMAKATTKLGVTIVVLLLLAVAGWWRWAHRGGIPAADTARAPTSPTAATNGGHAATTSDPVMFAQAGLAVRAVTGRVTFRGRPFPGATVHLVHAATETTLGEVKSGADGAFTFGDRPADKYVVTADAVDKIAAPVSVDLRTPQISPVVLALSGCSHLVGVVSDGSDTPIAHARVMRQGAPWPVVETDAEGRYDLCVRFGSATIQYSASGYHGVTSELTLDALTKHDVVLIPEATVAGTVVTADGTPVAGAWIDVDPFGKNRDRDSIVRARSDADGTFRIAQVAPGRNQLSAVAPGLASRRIEIVVGAGQVLEGVVLRVDAAAKIYGSVAAGGTPVVGAAVGLRVGNLDKAGTLAVTQADGSFVIDRAPRGDVAVYVEGYAVVTPRAVHVEGARADVKIEVEMLGTIRGRVTHAGAAVPDAYVTCPPRSVSSTVYTDDQGAFTCTGVQAGTHDVVAFEPGGHWGDTEVALRRGETKDIQIDLVYNASICGKVTDETGRPLRRIDVRVLEPKSGDQGSDLTAADGAFCARMLAGHARYQVNAFAGGQRLEPITQQSDVEVGDGRVDIQLVVAAPRHSIAGTVIDAHGAPIADAIVRVDPLNHLGDRILPTRGLVSTSITDTSGHFEVSRLGPGDYAVLATARDGSERIVQPVAADTHEVVVTLDPAGRIAGRSVGFASSPSITGILMAGAHEPIDVEVDGDRFSAAGLSPGTYMLTAVTDSGEGDSQHVVVRAGQTTAVTMTGRGTATVAGRLLDFKRRTPLPGQRCGAIARQGHHVGVIYHGPDSFTFSDSDGRFVLTAPAGDILVFCNGSKEVVAPRDQRIEVVIFAVPSNGASTTIDADFDGFARFDRRITELTRGGAADRAGLAIGDEVLAVDGASVAELDAGSTLLLITQRTPGTAAALTIKRGQETRTINVTVRATDY